MCIAPGIKVMYAYFAATCRCSPLTPKGVIKYYNIDNLYLMMIPLSMENESLGSPAIFHALIFTCSPSVVLSENSSEQGMPLVTHISRQSDT